MRQRSFTRRVAALLFRLLPVLVVIYGMRDGATSARALFASAKDLIGLAQASSTLYSAKRSLTVLRANGEDYPYDLAAYMREQLDNPGFDPGLDPWGNAYQIRVNAHGRHVIFTCGPDKSCRSKDDVGFVFKD